MTSARTAASSAVRARLARADLSPLLPAQQRVRDRLVAEELGEAVAECFSEILNCVCRNGSQFQPLHRCSVRRRGSRFANRTEVRHGRDT